MGFFHQPGFKFCNSLVAWWASLSVPKYPLKKHTVLEKRLLQVLGIGETLASAVDWNRSI